MSKKFIPQQILENFVYPNQDWNQYDQYLVHDINNNSVSGTVTNFNASITTSQVDVSFDYSWSKNNAEPFINDAGQLVLFSVHMMAPNTVYFKPWRMVYYKSISSTGSTTSSGSVSFSVSASDFQVASFNNGEYSFEIRFIGHRAIYPICQNSSELVPTPTPTPTPTLTPTPTITPTPTSTPTPTPSSYCGTQCRNWQYNNVPNGGDVIHYYRCSDGAAQTIAVGEGDTGTFCNCNNNGNPYADSTTQLTEIGSC